MELLRLVTDHGYLTAHQAAALGVHHHTLGRLVEAGQLTRSARGIYTLPEAGNRTDLHRLLVRAILDEDPLAAASHHSALALHGVALFDVPWHRVHLLDHRTSSRIRQNLHWHVLRPGDPLVDVDGYRVASLPLALGQVAAQFGVEPGLVSLDDALHRDLVTADDVGAILDSGRLRRGLVGARRALELADGRAESPGESRLRLILADAPWAYDIQVNLGGPGRGYRADALVEGRLVVEFDGTQKYGGERGAQAMVAEKTREDWIRGQGYGVLRVTWSELAYPRALRREIDRRVLATPPRLR